MVAIAGAESGFNTTATNVIGNSHGTDIGLSQINSYYHPEYDIAQLFYADYNAAAAYTISKKGTDFTPWSAFKNNAYKDYYKTALAAAGQIGEVIKNNPVLQLAAAILIGYFIYKLIK